MFIPLLAARGETVDIIEEKVVVAFVVVVVVVAFDAVEGVLKGDLHLSAFTSRTEQHNDLRHKSKLHCATEEQN